MQMENAEQRGDRHSARDIARTILASGERAIGPEARDSEGDGASDEHAARLSAEQLLARTEPDPFLLVVGVLGLGLMVWLVYNYVL